MPDIVVAEALDLAHAQTGSVDDAGMVFFVEDDGVVLADQGADCAEVDLHAGREYQGGFLADPFRQLTLEIFDDGHVAIQEARPGAAGAVEVDGVLRGFANFWIGGQTKVVVGAAHDDPATFKYDLSAFATIQRNEVRIGTGFAGDHCILKIVTFRK